MVSMLLTHLPPQYKYQIIFMQRNMKEIIASQFKMLDRQGKNPSIGDEKLSLLYEKHLHQIEDYLRNKSYIQVLNVSYANFINSPLEEAQRVCHFIVHDMDHEAMANVVDNSLYRNRLKTI